MKDLSRVLLGEELFGTREPPFSGVFGFLTAGGILWEASAAPPRLPSEFPDVLNVSIADVAVVGPP